MSRLLDGYCQFLKVVMTLLMALILIAVSVQIVSRYSGLVPRYIWTEEVARFCFVWIVMIGSMIAVRESSHFIVELLPVAKSAKERGIAQLIVHSFMLLMALVFAWYGIEFTRFGARQASEMSGINLASIYVSFPLAGVTWGLFLLEQIVSDVRMLKSDSSRPASPGGERTS